MTASNLVKAVKGTVWIDLRIDPEMVVLVEMDPPEFRRRLDDELRGFRAELIRACKQELVDATHRALRLAQAEHGETE